MDAARNQAPTPLWVSPVGSIALSYPAEDLARLEWRDHIDARLLDYLDVLAAYVERAPSPVHLLYDLTRMTGFCRTVLRNHAAFATRYEDSLGKIAVCGASGRVRFAIASVALMQTREIRGFASEEEAVHWLRV